MTSARGSTKQLAGIRPDESQPGFQHFRIEPLPLGDLTRASATYDSIRGKIESKWTLDGNTFTLDVTIPPTARATVKLPSNDHVIAPDGVHIADSTLTFELGSGTYQFKCDAKR